jgi:hypothetical protein
MSIVLYFVADMSYGLGMKTTARRSRYGKTSWEKSVDARLERTIVAAAGLSLREAHEAAKAHGRVLQTSRRSDGSIASVVV